MITVVMPVYNQIQYTKNILTRTSLNKIKPTEFIIIDNNSSENIKKIVNKFKNKLNITYIKNDINIGVNPAWNLGLKLAKTKYISILNNDLVLNNLFYKKIIDAFNLNENIGIVCPKTIKNPYKINEKDDHSKVKLIPMKKREGWAFTIKKEIIDKIKLIPNELKFFCGDDYLFYMTKYLNYKIMKMTNNQIYHWKNQTLKSEIPNWKQNELKKEKMLYKKWIKNFEKDNL